MQPRHGPSSQSASSIPGENDSRISLAAGSRTTKSHYHPSGAHLPSSSPLPQCLFPRARQAAPRTDRKTATTAPAGSRPSRCDRLGRRALASGSVTGSAGGQQRGSARAVHTCNTSTRLLPYGRELGRRRQLRRSGRRGHSETYGGARDTVSGRHWRADKRDGRR